MTPLIDTDLRERLIALRREFHRHAETGWTEFRTTARIAGILAELGYRVSVGKSILDLDSVMGRPSEAELSGFIDRALEQIGRAHV